jgi:hypothetical protein
MYHLIKAKYNSSSGKLSVRERLLTRPFYSDERTLMREIAAEQAFFWDGKPVRVCSDGWVEHFEKNTWTGYENSKLRAMYDTRLQRARGVSLPNLGR